MDSIDIKNTNLSELMVLMSCRLLGITKHSQMFIDEQKQIIAKMNMSKDVKEACLEALNSLEVQEVKIYG